MNQGKLNSHFSAQLETLKICHKQGWTQTIKVESENILILEKDLLPTLDEVYQSCQLQTFKAYKYDSYDVLQK